MAKANEIKRNMAVEYNGKLLWVRHIEVSSPSARGAATLYKMRFTDFQTGLKVEERFKGDDQLTVVELSKRPAMFSYTEGDTVIFMDAEDYSQYTFNVEDIADEMLFITEDIQDLKVMMIDNKLIGLELPSSVTMTIEQTDPSIKGASASARTKPAHFSTGLVIQVPEYIATGEKVQINVEEKRFMSRA
ncbi:MAG: elongation factor P-like protein YeiP [Kangiellaceae bacterium]|nr:elongation factor P-like protein YeiP [Kangiellaceae bacterium]